MNSRIRVKKPLRDYVRAFRKFENLSTIIKILHCPTNNYYTHNQHSKYN